MGCFRIARLPGKRLTSKTSSSVLGPSGVRWQVLDNAAGAELAPLDELSAGKPKAQRSLEVRTGENTSLGRITLRYDKPERSPPLTGAVVIHEVALQRVH